MITLQTIFDTAWLHFIVLNEPPANVKTEAMVLQCQYLTEDGRKCAIGLVLPDGHPSQSMNEDFSCVVERYPELFHNSVQLQSITDLWNFQHYLHDFLCKEEEGKWDVGVEERKRRYLEVAEQYGCKVPE